MKRSSRAQYVVEGVHREAKNIKNKIKSSWQLTADCSELLFRNLDIACSLIDPKQPAKPEQFFLLAVTLFSLAKGLVWSIPDHATVNVNVLYIFDSCLESRIYDLLRLPDRQSDD